MDAVLERFRTLAAEEKLLPDLEKKHTDAEHLGKKWTSSARRCWCLCCNLLGILVGDSRGVGISSILFSGTMFEFSAELFGMFFRCVLLEVLEL